MAHPDQLPEAESLERKLGKNYEVQKLIATGGMGAVYKARHIQLDRLVAIKILPPHIISMVDAAEFPVSERFEAEAKAMAGLLHQNIVAVHDFGQTEDGIHYIVMEFVDGEDIETLLDNGELAVENVLIITRQICSALSHSHKMGMVHRDIKPGNILIDRNGIAKVTDFGLVKVMGSNRFNTQVGFGTPGYYAPEIEKDGQSDERSDIYSFGVLLYQMLTRELPSGFWEPLKVARPDLDERFDDIVGRCLKRKPEERFQSIDEVKEALDEIAFSTPDGKVGKHTLSRQSLTKRLFIVFFSLFLVSSIASLFDIYFNTFHLGSLLDQQKEGQMALFKEKIKIWNLICYVTFPAAWAWVVFSLLHKDPQKIETKRSVLNLPWWGAGLSAIGWIATIPALFILMRGLDIPKSVQFLLPVSILINSGITILLGFLVIDMISQKLLYPHFFSRNERPSEVDGFKNVLLETRGIFWIVSSSVCPILALLLLVLSVNSFDSETFEQYRRDVGQGSGALFAPFVAFISIGFVLLGVFMFRYMMVVPVRELREAAIRIREGDFDVQIESYRTDEFGELAHEFNRMAAGLRERQHLREMVDQNATGKMATEISISKK